MKLMKTLVAFALVIVSVLAISIPALAAKQDQTYRITCPDCGKTAIQTRFYSKEVVNYDEKDYFNGSSGLAHYIRYNMGVPTSTDCSNCGYHKRGSISYFTAWQFMGY